MKSGVVRLILFLLVVVAFGGAGYNIAILERNAAGARAASRVFDDGIQQAERLLSSLQSAQFAYVANGQTANFWIDRAARLRVALSSRVKQLQQSATSVGAGAALSGALDGLNNLEQIDRSAQRYVQDAQTQAASDLIFTDLRQADEAVGGRLASARVSEREAADAAAEVTRRTELATAAGAGLFALLILVFLLPVGRRQKQDVETAPVSEPSLTIADAGRTTAPAPSRVHEQPAPWPPSDLSAAADLCTDFARMRETSELPALLERVAKLMNAAGVIVWMEDRTSGELRPAIAHGYPSQALSRIRGISKDADNATASAFREGTVQVVEAEDGGNGAIAVPLMTADGCVGVMAAELRPGSERASNTRALATIVGAQMATLVAPQAN